MIEDSGSHPPSIGRLAETRAILTRAVASAARPHALLVQQQQMLLEQRDAIMRAAHTRVAEATQTFAESQRIVAELRRTVEECTRQLKRQQIPPETVLALVKTVTRSSAQADLGMRDVQALVNEVVAWCIDAYYSAA
jgi:hypothetical protein